MRAARRVTIATALATALTLALAAGAAQAQEPTVWLCKPGQSPNPCAGSLETTIEEPDGSTRVERPEAARDPAVDCFYVYPTVSEQPSRNSDRTVEPQQTAIAQYQAQRFSQVCDVYAPMYRQRTLAAVAGPESQQREAFAIAYVDVLAAWREYLANDNRGRGVVLIGHSQGTRMLRQLVREEIDPRPEVRRRLVSAILLGGDVLVRRGSGSGGDFENVPACTAGDQLGCVIAWSTFFDPPPPNARFGRYAEEEGSGLPDGPTGPDLEVLCTDPSRLAGRSGPLESLVPSEPFPGFLGAGFATTYGGPQPSAPTPWIQPRDRYTARCERSNGAHVLRLAPAGLARRLNPFPDPTWGVHLVDGNIALGELVAVAGRQAAAYEARAERERAEGRRTARCLSPRARLGRRGAGRVMLGRTRAAVLRRTRATPVRRGARVLRWCVAGRRGRVSAVLGSAARRRGDRRRDAARPRAARPRRAAPLRVRLVTTTLRSHRLAGLRPGRSARRLDRALPRARRIAVVGRGRRATVVYRAGGRRGRRIVAVRRGRVRFLGAADRRLLRPGSRVALKRAVRRAAG